MKKVMSLLFVFVVLALVVVFIPKTSAENTYVTLDINPSVELIVTPRDKVIYANALNEDGEVLLSELDLVGLNVDDAVVLIIDTSIEFGFIETTDAETIVTVSSISDNARNGEMMQEKIKARINNALKNRDVPGHAEDKQENKYQSDFIVEAKAYGVSPGFYFLAQKAMFAEDTLTIEVALTMRVSELQAIVRDAFNQQRAIVQTLKDEFLATKHALIESYQDQFEQLEAQIDLLEAQIEVTEDETQSVALEASLALLVEDYEALRLELSAQIEVIRDEFVEASKALKETFKAFHLELRNRFKNQNGDDTEQTPDETSIED
ncbi:MAG: hypothetical protein WCZ19_04725 [Acholeplasma sp.]